MRGFRLDKLVILFLLCLVLAGEMSCTSGDDDSSTDTDINTGIDNGDVVRIEENSYDCENQDVLDDIDILIERGVNLVHDC